MPPRGIANLALYDVQRTVANKLLATNVALIMVHMLLSHANVRTTAPPGRRDERAKKQAIRTRMCRIGRERTADRQKHSTQGEREGSCHIGHHHESELSPARAT